MCNLYRMTRSVDEVAALFEVEPVRGSNYGEDVFPSYPGLVVAEGKVRTMNWGFPLVLRGKQGQKLKPKPVNNAREDKLTTRFWKDSFETCRCLIPIEAWAEAEGDKGRKTRTWYSLPGGGPFAVAGLWRPTEEWGDAYTMVMVDGHPQMAEVHDRMPLILSPENYVVWTTSSPSEASDLCRTWRGELQVDQTDQPWSAKGSHEGQARLL